MTAARAKSEVQDEAAPIDALLEAVRERIGDDKVVRRKLPAGGRVHLDRPLPFIVIHREHEDAAPSAARGVAAASPAYAIWPAGAEADAVAYDLIDGLDTVFRDRFSQFLVLEVHDVPVPEAREPNSAEPVPCHFQIQASGDETARAVAASLRKALLELDLEWSELAVDEAPDDHRLTALPPGVPRVALGVPRIYARPDGKGVFPGLLHALVTDVLDAALHGLCAVAARASMPTPVHYRALGRRGFIRAARQADQKLTEVAASFDFLLGVSPINTSQAWEAFRESGHERAPLFHYRPLPIDVSRQKRALYAVDIDGVEDPVLETLFREKQQEIDLQLALLQTRDTPRFRDGSTMLYGRVSDRLAEEAEAILSALPQDHPGDDDDEAALPVDCHDVRDAANTLVAGYRRHDPDFRAEIAIREDVSGLMVSGPRLLISTAVKIRRSRLDPLLQHEVSVHLLTHFTGRRQGLQIFRSGLAGYEGVQEGLGVFAEFAVGGLTRQRLRLLAARVLAVRAMLRGADFLETFRLLHDEWNVSARTAFHVCARVHRSGGLAKDFIYLQGLLDVLDHLAAGGSLEPFWCGKIALQHVPVVDELFERGFLSRPSVEPEFMSRDAARPNLDRARAGLSLSDLLRNPA